GAADQPEARSHAPARAPDGARAPSGRHLSRSCRAMNGTAPVLEMCRGSARLEGASPEQDLLRREMSRAFGSSGREARDGTAAAGPQMPPGRRPLRLRLAALRSRGKAGWRPRPWGRVYGWIACPLEGSRGHVFGQFERARPMMVMCNCQ